MLKEPIEASELLDEYIKNSPFMMNDPAMGEKITIPRETLIHIMEHFHIIKTNEEKKNG